MLGGSRAQVSGPTGAFIVIVYGIVQQYGYNGLVIATLIAGVLLIVQGVAECMRCYLAMKTGKWPQRMEDARETEDLLKGQQGGPDFHIPQSAK